MPGAGGGGGDGGQITSEANHQSRGEGEEARVQSEEYFHCLQPLLLLPAFIFDSRANMHSRSDPVLGVPVRAGALQYSRTFRGCKSPLQSDSEEEAFVFPAERQQ